jgi:hypothetical protein
VCVCVCVYALTLMDVTVFCLIKSDKDPLPVVWFEFCFVLLLQSLCVCCFV